MSYVLLTCNIYIGHISLRNLLLYLLDEIHNELEIISFTLLKVDVPCSEMFRGDHLGN